MYGFPAYQDFVNLNTTMMKASFIITEVLNYYLNNLKTIDNFPLGKSRGLISFPIDRTIRKQMQIFF